MKMTVGSWGKFVVGDRQTGRSEELGESSPLPSFSSQPSRLGLKKVWVRSLPSSSGMENGSFFMLSNRFCPRALVGKEREREKVRLISDKTCTQLS